MYKAFVSSTFMDLRNHRSEVIRTLAASGFQVDPMENWQADRDTPQKFSADRLDGCKICILIVAFRRGHLPDGSNQSITQIEYAEAVRRKIDILPFLLADDTPVDMDGGWPAAFDERSKDPEVDRWRGILRGAHGVGQFGADPKTVRIEAAIARWVVQTESDRASRFRRNIYLIVAGCMLMIAAGLLYAYYVYRNPGLRSHYLSRFLAFHDPLIFNHSPTGNYELGRVLDSYATLTSETNFAEEIRSTNRSFDMIVNNASYTRHSQRQNFIDMVERGAKVRIILWNYTEENRPAYDAFHFAIKQNPEGPRGEAQNVHRELVEWKRQVDADRIKYKGSIEFRWNSSPLFYTMWVRDWSTPESIGHLGVHFYRGQEYWLNFRVSSMDGSRLLDNLHAEFEEAWSRSKELPEPK